MTAISTLSLKPEDSAFVADNPDLNCTPLYKSPTGFYELVSTDRWSEDIEGFERFYEIYNVNTKVVEIRLQPHLPAAITNLIQLDHLLQTSMETPISAHLPASTGNVKEVAELPRTH